MKRILGLLIALMVLALPITVSASQQVRVLEPGNVYEFTGLDARVVSHVSVRGAGRFQIVSWNEDGEVTRFGIAAGRFSVSGLGVTEISPLVPMTVTFDSSRLGISERAGFALRQIEIDIGETVILENRESDTLNIRTNNDAYFDFVVTNRAGDAINFDVDVRLPQISIPARGEISITAADEAVLVYFPENWYGEEVLVGESDYFTLQKFLLRPNQAYTLTILTDNTYAPRLSAFYENEILLYEYVIRGRDGHVSRYGESEGEEIRLAPQQAFIITPAVYTKMYFPTEWGIEVENGVAAPVFLTLEPNMSLEISNSDELRAHTIFLRCSEDEREFSFDYVMLYDDEIFFTVTEDFILPQAAISLPAGATVTITAIDAYEALSVSVPDIPAISADFTEHSALVRRRVSQGESVFVTSSDDVTILIHEDPDFIRYDENGEILHFGIVSDGAYFELEESQSALFTSNEYTATLIFPRVSADALTIESRNEAALYRIELTYGEVLQIDNSDRQRYNRYFLVQSFEDRETSGFVYDFVMTANDGTVMDYGAGIFGYHHLPINRRITLMPQEGETLYVAFPESWLGSTLRTRRVSHAPLHRVTVSPGRSIVLNNRTNNNFVIANNSRDTRAGFHIYGQGEMVRRYQDFVINEGEQINYGDFFPPGWSIIFDYFDLWGFMNIPAPPQFERIPHYEFVPARPVNIHTDIPEEGEIFLAAGTRITLTAALGEDLELWLPRSWAQSLGLLR